MSANIWKRQFLSYNNLITRQSQYSSSNGNLQSERENVVQYLLRCCNVRRIEWAPDVNAIYLLSSTAILKHV